jgi:hypothetical protein
MNYEIAGKNLEKDFKCPICDETLLPQEYEITNEPFAYSTRRGDLFLSESKCSMKVNFRCQCGIEVDLDIPDEAMVSCRTESLKRINDMYEFDWEYLVMSVTSVKYGLVKNLGNYETELFEAEVVLDEHQTPEDAVAECKSFVKKQLGLGPSDEDLEAARQLLREEGEL